MQSVYRQVCIRMGVVIVSQWQCSRRDDADSYKTVYHETECKKGYDVGKSHMFKLKHTKNIMSCCKKYIIG